MDKWGVEVDMWTSLQNAQLDHIPTSPTPLTHKGYAFGLTRFACQTAILKKSKIPNTKSKKPGENTPNCKNIQSPLHSDLPAPTIGHARPE
jgi:hypothetical protein